MLYLRRLGEERKKQGKMELDGRMARMGYYPFSGLCRNKESLSQQGSLGVVLRRAFPCHDRVLGQQGVFDVATRFWCLYGRGGCVMDGLCRDMTLGVATTAFQCGTEACYDRVFSIMTGFSHLVSRQSVAVWGHNTVLGVATRTS